MDIPLYAALAYLVMGAVAYHVGYTEVWPRIQKKRAHKARGRKAAATRRSKAVAKAVNGADQS